MAAVMKSLDSLDQTIMVLQGEHDRYSHKRNVLNAQVAFFLDAVIPAQRLAMSISSMLFQLKFLGPLLSSVQKTLHITVPIFGALPVHCPVLTPCENLC